jgi:hypothetical protein
VLCEGASEVCNENATDIRAVWGTAFIYDSLESYLLALESIGVTPDKHTAILFLLIESCIPEGVLKVWWRNTGALLRDDNRSTFGDRVKDLLSFLCSEVVGEEGSSLVKSGFRLIGDVWNENRKNRQIYCLVRRRKSVLLVLRRN